MYNPLELEKAQPIELIQRFLDTRWYTPEQRYDNELEKYFLLLIKCINLLDSKIMYDALTLFISQEKEKAKVSSKKAKVSKIELLLTVHESQLDTYLLKVIKERKDTCKRKGNILIVLPIQAYEALMESNYQITQINKLSFLHHFQPGMDPFPGLSYLENAGKYTQGLPDLEYIVLRTCSGANFIQPLQSYRLTLLKEGSKLNRYVLARREIAIQQKYDSGILTTWVRHDNPLTGIPIILNFTNIGKKRSIEEFSKEELQQISDAFGDLPISLNVANQNLDEEDSEESSKDEIAPPPREDPDYIKMLVNNFYHSSLILTPEEIETVKKWNLRASTKEVKDFGERPCIAKTFVNSLPKKNSPGFWVKAYISGWYVNHGRVIPDNSHGRKKYPKAYKVRTPNTCYLKDCSSSQPSELKQKKDELLKVKENQEKNICSKSRVTGEFFSPCSFSPLVKIKRVKESEEYAWGFNSNGFFS
jgi:hypothetical protein